MKQVLAIWFSVLLVLGSMADSFVMMNFKANQSYIADNICIDKDKTENLCSGKCVLSLLFSDSENDLKLPFNQSKEVNFEWLFCALDSDESNRRYTDNVLPPQGFKNLFTGVDFKANIFHPPRPRV